MSNLTLEIRRVEVKAAKYDQIKEFLDNLEPGTLVFDVIGEIKQMVEFSPDDAFYEEKDE